MNVGVGNFSSIQNWLATANIQSNLISNPSLLSSDTILLPGVGAAGMFMRALKQREFDTAILDHVNSNRRLIGICLGFQILCDGTEEDGGVEGLSIFKTNVEKLKGLRSHNQWQSILIDKRNMGRENFNSNDGLSKRKKLSGRVFYNHEYGVVKKHCLPWSTAISEELKNYCSIAVSGKVIGMQFHPEKSQITGLELIKMII